MELVSSWEKKLQSFNKYQSRLSYLFVVLTVAGLIWYHSSINWLLVYVIYSVAYIFGVEVGYHRSLCHGVRYNRLFENVCLWLGSLSHIGGFRESVLYHLHHHANADTDADHHKSLLTALNPVGARIEWSRSRYIGPLKRIKQEKLLSWIDSYYYLWLLINYGVLAILFGVENMIQYVLIPMGFVLIVHRYAAYLYHAIGYRNYQLSDNSRNIIWLLPFVFGENWHNNHHFAPRSATTSKNWWEIDPAHILGKPFLIKSK